MIRRPINHAEPKPKQLSKMNNKTARNKDIAKFNIRILRNYRGVWSPRAEFCTQAELVTLLQREDTKLVTAIDFEIEQAESVAKFQNKEKLIGLIKDLADVAELDLHSNCEEYDASY